MAYSDKAVQREYQRNWRKDWREEWIKTNGPCVICGSDRYLRAFSYTRNVPHAVWSWSLKRKLEVLQQCIVLCSSCHRIESIKKRQNKPELSVVPSVQHEPDHPTTITMEAKEATLRITVEIITR